MGVKPLPQGTRVPLAKIKRYPSKLLGLAGRRVRIFSGEHGLWWRPPGAGYTGLLSQAGVYVFEDAWARSNHSGPEKMLVYEVVDQPPAKPSKFSLKPSAPAGYRWVRVGERLRSGDRVFVSDSILSPLPPRAAGEGVPICALARHFVRPVAEASSVERARAEAFVEGARWAATAKLTDWNDLPEIAQRWVRNTKRKAA